MGDVAQRVVDLRLGQRPARPVGEARALVDVGAGQLRDQRVVGDLLAEAAHHGRDLRVEERPRQLAQMVEDLEILPGGVHHLEHALVGHHREQRPEIEARCQRVDRDRLLLARDLDQAELGEVGAVAHELGVDGDEALAAHAGAEGGQRCVVGDQRHGLGIISGPSPRLTPQELSCPLPAVSTGTAGREALVSDGNQHASLSYAPLRRSAPGTTSMPRCASAAGYTESGITASYSSSTCATMPGSSSWSASPTRRRSRPPRRMRVESVITVTGRVVARSAGDRQPGPADRRGRAGRRGAGGRLGGRAAAAAGQQRPRLSRGDAAQVPLPRPAPREDAQEHRAALADHRQHPPPDDRAGLHRVPDADPDRLVARGCARLPGAVAAASGPASTRCRRRRSSTSSST